MITEDSLLPLVMGMGAITMVFTALGLIWLPFLMAALITVSLMAAFVFGSIAYFEWKRTR